MNVTGFLINGFMSAPTPNQGSTGHLTEGDTRTSFFKQLLETEQTVHKSISTSDVTDEELLGQLSELSSEALEELYHLLLGQMDKQEDVSSDELIKRLADLFGDRLTDEITVPQLGQSTSVGNAQFMVGDVQLHELDQAAIIQQFNELFKEVESILQDLSVKGDQTRSSTMILQLLEKWSQLESKYNYQPTMSDQVQSLSEAEAKTLKLWQELLGAYEKRNGLMNNQQYTSQAKVTSKDISRWLNNHHVLQVESDQQVQTQQAGSTNQPVTRVEQYVIYMNQNGSVEEESTQLLNQFGQVMKKSQFLSLNNGTNQLSIALRPDNLGEMMVRLTEVNGEMTLKIIVSSQATRQMLESNLHQLKHMFSPHQVVIEEREATVETVQHAHKEQEQSADEEEHPRESGQEKPKEPDKNVEKQFSEILLSEKV